jgi:hypothetical protein
LDACAEQGVVALVSAKPGQDIRDDVVDVVRDVGKVLAHASRHRGDFLPDRRIAEFDPTHLAALSRSG